jgi:hypothetical protein
MGSDFSDFFRQLPLGMIACMCLSGAILVGSLIAIFFARSRRRASGTVAESDTTAATSFSTPTEKPKSYDTGELPDLDVLLNVPIPPAPAPVASRAVKPGTYEVKLADTGEAVQAAEVMIIMRDVDEGRLVVQMGDQTYSNLSNFPDGKNRFLKIMKELAGIVAAKPASTNAEPTPSPESTTSDPSAAPNAEGQSGLLSRLAENKDELPTMGDLLASAPQEPKKVIPTVPPPPLPDGSMPGDLPKFKLGETPIAPRRGSGFIKMTKEQEREMKKPVPEINIAVAIQEYLQHKLRHTPEYAGRSINVSPSPSGGVTIEVDGKFYEAVSDIVDGEVRAFLAMTIEEWQSRQ